MNSRETALKILYEIEYDGAYSNIALKNNLSADFSRQDKAFITRIVYGVVRYKLTLDYIISKFSSVKIKKLSKYVLLILRMGIYQAKFMDNVPDSATVNEAVKLAKRYAGKSAGFVNAVLRKAITNFDKIEYPKERIPSLSVKYSFTEDMVRLFDKTPFCEELLASLNTECEASLRINSLKGGITSVGGVPVTNNPLYEYSATVSGVDIAGSCEYNDGLFTVQDVAAMMASVALMPNPGETCIDVCAAPGGKTTHLAELMKNDGRIYAFDMHEHKIDIINKNALRMGVDIITAKCHDSAVALPDLIGKADKVLCDVPCSGLGIIRKKPDIKWSKDDISALPEIQYNILTESAKYLKIGGELVYSTCTLNPDENEGVIEKFIKNNPDFCLTEIKLPSALDRENCGYITLYPNIDNTDGFFISKVKRCK